MARSKLKIGDTVYLVIEHFYDLPDRAGARMEYLPVQGRVTGFIRGGYTQAKVEYTADRVLHLQYPKLSNYGKTFFASMDEAVQAAEGAADRHDRTWSVITGEMMRRPWREHEMRPEDMPMQECGRRCDTVFNSLRCCERRGFIAGQNTRWLRDSNGRYLRGRHTCNFDEWE